MDDQVARISGKLAVARESPVAATAFGATNHRFRLGSRLPEIVVAGFEERHEVALPAAYRRFLVELGNGGAGPGYGLTPLEDACGRCLPGHASVLMQHNRLPEPKRQEYAESVWNAGPAGLETLEWLGTLTAEGLLPMLTQPDVERRRTATRLLGWSFTGDVSDDVVTALFGDEDRLVRAHAVFAASGSDQFTRRMRAMNETETDPWVRILLKQAAEDEQWRRQAMESEQQATGEPPF